MGGAEIQEIFKNKIARKKIAKLSITEVVYNSLSIWGWA